MTRSTLGMVALWLVTACGSSSSYRTTVGPTGAPVAIIDCKNDPGGCYVLAGEVCPRGYVVLDVNDSKNVRGGAVANQQGAVASVRTEDARMLMIECRGGSEPKKKPDRCGYFCGPEHVSCPWLDTAGW